MAMSGQWVEPLGEQEPLNAGHSCPMAAQGLGVCFQRAGCDILSKRTALCQAPWAGRVCVSNGFQPALLASASCPKAAGLGWGGWADAGNWGGGVLMPVTPGTEASYDRV